MNFYRVTAAAIVFCILTIAAFAQEDEPVRIETNLVSIGVVVKDKSGNFVKGLNKEQFKIYDDKAQRDIEFFSAEDAPVSYGIIYDLHPTTSERTRAILQAIKSFAENLKTEDDYFTVVFNDKGSLELDFVPSVEQVDTHLATDSNDKPKSLYDAIYQAGEKIRSRVNAKRTLIIISDGKDHQSHHNYETLRNQLRSFNVQVYSVLLDEKDQWGFSDITMQQKQRRLEFDSSPLDRAAIAELSDKSGGASQSAHLYNSEELRRIFDRIKAEMYQQYSIGFYPAQIDKKWHKVEVKVNTAGLKLSYRKGYQSKD